MKCSLGEEKGSEISGELNEWSAGKAELVGENGGRESKRTASRRVGWKGPPCRSLWRRCVGRTWPRTKKVDIALQFDLIGLGLIHGVSGGEEGRFAHLFLKTMS